MMTNGKFQAGIVGMHRHRHIPQQGFRPRGGHGDAPRALHKGVMDMIIGPVHLLRHNLKIRQRRLQLHIPIDQSFVLINQSITVHGHKYSPHRVA